MNSSYLIVDLDNSCLKIDLFKEKLCKSLIKNPSIFFKTVFLAMTNRAKAKTFISKVFKIESHSLPFNNRVIEIITN